LRLDDRGFKQLAAASRKWLREAERIEEAAAARLEHRSDGDGDGGVETGLVVMVFEGRSGDGRTERARTRDRDTAVSGTARD
jgi:hypothetical protein